MTALEINLSLPDFTPEEQVRMENESRAMFVARLENMQKQGDHWLTIAAVFALQADCDMLAQQSLLKTRA